MINSCRIFALVCFALLQGGISGQQLIAYYPFDHITADESGFGNDGVMFGGVQSCEDRFGNPCGAFNFNGFDGYIKVNNSASLQSINQAFSFTCWFKLENSHITNDKWLTFICKGGNTVESQNSPQYRVQIFQSNSQSTISINTDFTEYDLGYSYHPLDFTNWQFYAVIYDGITVTVYLNDRRIWEFPYTGVFSKNSDPLYIGMDIPGSLEYYSGALDELRLYNGTLSEDQILDIYNSEDGMFFNDDIELECPGNITVPVLTGSCYTLVNYPQPILKVNCGTATIRQTLGLVSGSMFEVGTHLLSFEAVGSTGQKRTCTTKITVEDKEPPIMNCPNDTIIYIAINEKSVKYIYPVPLAFDNCSSVKVTMTNGLKSGELFEVGSSKQEFLAIDESGNSSICSYFVEVKSRKADEVLDSLVCPEDIAKPNDLNKCGANVVYDLQNRYSDFELVDGLTSGSFFPVGITGMGLEKTIASGLERTCIFKISVTDEERPNISCSGDILAYVSDGLEKRQVFYSMPIVSDNCGIMAVKQIEGLKSDALFPIGVTRNVFNAIDLYGNIASCEFNVIVKDTIKNVPIININNQDRFVSEIPDSIIDNGKIKLVDCVITLVVYDDNVEDSDTVSLYFNNEEFIKQEKIKLKKNGTIIRELHINPNIENVLVVRAWNNGAISPNTLKIDFYNGSFVGKEALLSFTKPYLFKVIHARPGIAASINLNCNNDK